jgi:hypothetical protein
MYRKPSEAMPPLWLWAALGIATVTVFVMVYRFGVVKRANDFRSRVAYVQTRMRSAGEKPVVLILGTSLTQSDLDKTRTMEESVEQLLGKEVVIIKLWKRATHLKTMAEQLHDLEKIHPALLIVEANMFCYSPRPMFINESLQMIRGIMRLDSLHEPYEPDLRQDSGYRYKGGLNELRDPIEDTAQITSFRQLAKKIHENGTSVLLVNFPIEDKEERKKWNSADTLFFNRNYSYLKAQVPFQFYRPDFYLDSSYFVDHAHMNYKGCTRFSNWMCALIAKELTRL